MGKEIKLRIIIPINTGKYNQYLYDNVISVLLSNVALDVVNIKGGSESIECRYNLMENEPFVLDEVRQAEKDGIDGIFVSDMDFCGVEVAREITNIPIIGGFRPNSLTAMALGQKFAIITILDSIKEYQIEHIRAFGFSENFAGIESANISVEALTKMFEDEKYKKEVIEGLGEKSLDLIEKKGADVIIFGCTGFIGVADGVSEYLLKRGYDIPVLDPNRIGINFLYNIASNNLKQSRRTYAKISK